MEKMTGTGLPEAFAEKMQKLLGEEAEILEGAGGAFFGKSVEENRKHLSLSMERLNFLIEEIRKGQKEKQKVYQTVSVMCGVLLIILLL